MLGSVIADGHERNSFFAESDPVHRFNPTRTNRLLRDEFRRRNVEINTADLNRHAVVDFELHFEGRPLSSSSTPRFLVALENPIINPLNADAAYFENFRQVFTWNPKFSHLSNVTMIGVPNWIELPHWPAFAERRIFCCLINANKQFKSETPNDLYKERVAVIRWYERNAPERFDLYGLGWGKPPHATHWLGKLSRRFQRLAAQIIGLRPFPSWRGELAEKSSVLLNAKFAYCYENVYGVTGYVTEKIFDCMMNGCIPVYWGADDIGERIPEDCFVDRRAFRDTHAVDQALLSMSPAEFSRRQRVIRGFLESPRADLFRASHFAETVVQGVLSQLSDNSAAEFRTREMGR